jgi:hypothetical protein
MSLISSIIDYNNSIDMSSTDTFTIPKGFAKVILVVAGMNVQMFLQGGKVVGVRKQVFNK